MLQREDKQKDFFDSYVYQRLLPQKHILLDIKEKIDFSFVEEETKELYSATMGRPSFPPSVLFKMLFLEFFCNLSDYQVVEQVRTNVLYRYFAGLGIKDTTPDDTTLVVFRRRLGENHFSQRDKPVQFTRSRPYHKNDNAHVEQKNWTQVRQWLGYHRLDKPVLVGLINDLYTQEWRLYHNFFQPSVKLVEKKLVDGKHIKRYDAPKTPYQRVLDSSYVEVSVKRTLKKQFENLNPFKLRKIMESKLKNIFRVLCSKKSQATIPLTKFLSGNIY